MYGNWQLTGRIVGTTAAEPTMIMNYIPCVDDNVFVFMNDGTYTVDGGTTKCNSADPDKNLYGGTWTIDGDRFTTYFNSFPTSTRF